MRPGSVLLSALTLLGLACAGRRGLGPTAATETPSPGPGAPPAGPVVPPPLVESASAPGQAPGSDPTGRGSHAQQERRAIFEAELDPGARQALRQDAGRAGLERDAEPNTSRWRWAPPTGHVLPVRQPDDGRAGPVAHGGGRAGRITPAWRLEPERRRAARERGSATPDSSLRVIEGRPTVTAVRPSSSAERAGPPARLHRDPHRRLGGENLGPRWPPAAPGRGTLLRRLAAARRLIGPARHAGHGQVPRRPRPTRRGGAGARSPQGASRCSSGSCRRCIPRCASRRSATSASSPSTSSSASRCCPT